MSLRARLKRMEQSTHDPLVKWLSQEMDKIADAAMTGQPVPDEPQSWQEAELLKRWGLDE